MRNNTKLKELLTGYELTLSMDNKDINMIVFNKTDHVSFVVTGKNLSELLNKAIKVKSDQTKARQV